MKDISVTLLGSYDCTAEVENYRFNLPYGAAILTGFLRDKGVPVKLEDLSVCIEGHNRENRFSGTRIDLGIFDNSKRVIQYVYNGREDPALAKQAALLAGLIDTADCGLLGISIRSYYQMLMALVLVKEVKARSAVPIVLGGSFITLFGKYYFERSSFIDYMIVGEGQEPLLELTQFLRGGRSLDSVSNLIRREEGRMKVTGFRTYPVEALALPDYSDLPVDFYRTYPYGVLYFPYRIARGCLYNCSFCTYRSLEPELGAVPLEKVIADVKKIAEQYSDICLQIVTTSINSSYEYMEGLSRALFDSGIDIVWSVNARLDNLDPHILRTMKESGCLALEFGLESGSPRILDHMGKNIDLDKASLILRQAHEAGIKNVINIMVGYPGEREDDILQTIGFIKKNAAYIYAVPFYEYVMTIASPLYDHASRYGITNIRSSTGEFDTRYVYAAFDEISGLTWERKKKQTRRFYEMILKANFTYVLKSKYPFFAWVPFPFYLLWRKIVGVRSDSKGPPPFYVKWVWVLVKKLHKLLHTGRAFIK